MRVVGGSGGEVCKAGGRFRGDKVPLPWWYTLVGNRLLGLTTWRSLLSTRMAGDVLDPSFNRAADTAHHPCIPTNPAVATLETTAWRLSLQRTDERVGLLPHAIARIRSL